MRPIPPNTLLNREVKSLEKMVKQLQIALADAIRRPLGVVPASADGLITQEEIDSAEKRRESHAAQVISHAEPRSQGHASGQIPGCLVDHDPYMHNPPEVK